MEEQVVLRAAEAPDFIKDEDAGALLNTNTKGLQAYRQQREAARKTIGMQARMESLEQSVEELKALLIKALSR